METGRGRSFSLLRQLGLFVLGRRPFQTDGVHCGRETEEDMRRHFSAG